MEEQLLKTFARSVTGYFDTLTQTPVQLGTPFLGERGENLAMDFSAIIGISGAFRGNVFYTAPRGKLRAILPLLGEADPALGRGDVGAVAVLDRRGQQLVQRAGTRGEDGDGVAEHVVPFQLERTSRAGEPGHDLLGCETRICGAGHDPTLPHRVEAHTRAIPVNGTSTRLLP